MPVVGCGSGRLGLTGTLDEVALSDKVLSAARIAAHYNASGLV